MLNDPKGPAPIPERAYRDPDLDGVSVRAGWGTIEPEAGRFSWVTFDREIARAKQSGKKVMLRVYTGFRGQRMADWVYAMGAERFEFAESAGFTEKVGTRMALPVPWNPVFLQEWTKLVLAMGKRYDHEPTVVLVQMAGLDYTGGEMHLPSTKEDKAHWEQMGYTKAKLVGAWRTVIDAYAEAFPDKYLALDVSLPVYRDGTVEEVMSYAAHKLGRRLCIQHNALAASTNPRAYPHMWVAAAREHAIIGFQQLCPVTPRGSFNKDGERFGGTLPQALNLGLETGMSYLEIYTVDMENRELRPIIHQYVQRMRRPSGSS
jgi:hypothetical protein